MNKKFIQVLVGSALFSLTGCAASMQVTRTAHSIIEQQLLVSSLNRAFTTLDIEQLKGKTVAIDFYGLTSDKDFAREFCTAWLQSQLVHMATGSQKAELRLKIFANVLGVDQGEAFLGIPATTVPVLNSIAPEIALFKSVTNQGRAEIQVYIMDEASGQFLTKSPLGAGQATYSQYTILIVIHYTRTDLDEE